MDAICVDTSLSLRARLPALHDLFVEEPERYTHWKDRFWSDEIERIEAAYACLTDNIWMRDVAAEFFHAALEQEQDPHQRARIWKELAKLVEGTFASTEAAAALGQILQAKDGMLDSDLVMSLLPLSKISLEKSEYQKLVVAAASSGQLETHAVVHVARELIDLGLDAMAADILQRDRMALKPNGTGKRCFDYLLALRATASVGQRREAIEGLNAFCNDPKNTIVDRTLACRILSRLGETRAANHHLEALARRARSFEDRLAIADTASDQHHWPLARRILLALKAAPESSKGRCRLAAGLAAAGLKTSAMAILKELDAGSPDFLWAGGFDLLLENGQRRWAAAICANDSQSPEMSVNDRIEALDKLGEAGWGTIARRLLVTLIEDEATDFLDKADGAVVLHRLGFKAEARSVLFDLASQPRASSSSTLWLADAMLGCGLNTSATIVLASINEADLDDDEQDRLAQMKDDLGLIAVKVDCWIH